MTPDLQLMLRKHALDQQGCLHEFERTNQQTARDDGWAPPPSSDPIRPWMSVFSVSRRWRRRIPKPLPNRKWWCHSYVHLPFHLFSPTGQHSAGVRPCSVPSSKTTTPSSWPQPELGFLTTSSLAVQPLLTSMNLWFPGRNNSWGKDKSRLGNGSQQPFSQCLSSNVWSQGPKLATWSLPQEMQPLRPLAPLWDTSG